MTTHWSLRERAAYAACRWSRMVMRPYVDTCTCCQITPYVGAHQVPGADGCHAVSALPFMARSRISAGRGCPLILCSHGKPSCRGAAEMTSPRENTTAIGSGCRSIRRRKAASLLICSLRARACTVLIFGRPFRSPAKQDRGARSAPAKRLASASWRACWFCGFLPEWHRMSALEQEKPRSCRNS